MITRRAILAIMAACGSMPAGLPSAVAHDIKHKSLQIVHPWAHASADPSSPSADVYMTIRSKGRAADRLVSVSSARAQQHQLIPIAPDAFVVAPGKDVKLGKATGFVRLLGLSKPLYVHDNFSMTLVFEKAGRIDVEVHIEEAIVQEPHKH